MAFECDFDDLMFESFDVCPILSMSALLQVFKVKLQNREFEYQDNKYKIEFDWFDGLKKASSENITKSNKGPSNMQSDVLPLNIKVESLGEPQLKYEQSVQVCKQITKDLSLLIPESK